MVQTMTQVAKRIQVPVTERLRAGLTHPESLGFAEGASQAQIVAELAGEGLEHRAARLRLEARRARYAAWAGDAAYVAAGRADAEIALSEKAI